MKSLQKLHLSLLLGFLSVVLLMSCDTSYFEIEELPDYQYNPTLAFPIVNSSLTLKDLIREEDREHLRYGQDNLVTLLYNEQVLSFHANEFFSIPDQQVHNEVTLDMQMKSLQQDFSQSIPLDVGNGVRLDSVALKGGTFLFKASAQQLQAAGYDPEIEVSFPQSRDELGNPLSFWVPVGEPVEVDLQGYTLELASGQSTHNQLLMDYKVVVSGNGNAQQPNYTLQLESNFLDLEVERVYGYLGNHVKDFGSRLIALDFFSALGDGVIEFAQPSVTLRASNSIGVPIDLSVDPFVAIKGGVGYDIEGLADPVRVNTPLADRPLESVTTEVSLTADNSNIAEAMARFPEEIIYGMTLEVNPEGNEPNFAFDSGQLDVEIEVSLPLDGRLSGISLKDTFDIDLQQDVEEIQWVELNLEVANGFPLDARVQVQLLDASNALIMNLFEDQDQERLVASGQIDGQGRVTAPGVRNTRIMLQKDQVQQFFNTSRIVVVSWLNTANEGTSMVKILSDYELKVNLGARVNVHSTVSF